MFGCPWRVCTGALREPESREKKSFKPVEQEREDVQEKRRIFEKTLAKIELERLVFIGESGCNIAMTMAHARAPAGERVAEKRPTNWGQNINDHGRHSPGPGAVPPGPARIDE